MTDHDIKQLFYSLVSPSHPNEWETADVLDLLKELQPEYRDALLKHVPTIWPISHSLCYSYLQHGSQQVQVISTTLLPEWVRQLLFHYETAGLRAAEQFMTNTQTEFINKQTHSSDVTFMEINKSMAHYLHGISASNLSLAASSTHWTDTKTIFLPTSIKQFANSEEKHLFYKFIITYQWVLIHIGCFKLLVRHNNLNKRIQANFIESELYKAYCFVKACNYIREELPGLWKRSLSLVSNQLNQPLQLNDNELSRFIIRFISENLQLKQDKEPISYLINIKKVDSFLATYPHSTQDKTVAPILSYLLGDIKPKQSVATILEERRKLQKRFTKTLASILPKTDNTNTTSTNNTSRPDNANKIIKQLTEATQHEKATPSTVKIDNEHITIPQELIEQFREITNDLGSIPIGYVQAATGIAGSALLTESAQQEHINTASHSSLNFTYDEWDYRRQGYRKDWCTLIIEELPLIKTHFLEKTLEKHCGLRKQLQKQFEAMQTSQQIVKRQRDGDELDLEAIIDAIGSKAAGKPVSDRLFSRLQRNTRNISTLFLIDMSNSTSGWINTFIKEALVLLCEAMEKLGDHYGIYGFSGMRRSRCKLYPIKNIHEGYNDETKQRLASITPKDYTRMAPAIRHLTTLLQHNDASTRLLIVLSDGKPEDYDAYNGEYAIEDTKKALLETKGMGIVPFCITIDKEAHSYLAHMFGQKNYTFINKIERLPTRIPQIYRSLTQ